MKTRRIFTYLLTISSFITISVIGQVHQEEFKWLTDIDSARKLAEKEGKPLLVVFR